MTLVLLEETFAVCRLPADSPLPGWALGTSAGSFVAIARTGDELSIVCALEAVPEGVRSEPGWRCLRVAGTLDFAQVGVLASLLVPLAAAGIAVFVVSTFDTDYLLVKGDRLDGAIEVLRREGQFVETAWPTRGSDVFPPSPMATAERSV